jgi:RHS repeat-associated protein
VVNYAGVEASGGHVQFNSFGAPVGGISAVAADFLFGLAGMRMDPTTGMYEALARWYSPSATRFLCPDPAGMAGSGTNLYAYCGNSPVENVDPSGECYGGVSYTSPTSYSLGSAFGSLTSTPQLVLSEPGFENLDNNGEQSGATLSGPLNVPPLTPPRLSNYTSVSAFQDARDAYLSQFPVDQRVQIVRNTPGLSLIADNNPGPNLSQAWLMEEEAQDEAQFDQMDAEQEASSGPRVNLGTTGFGVNSAANSITGQVPPDWSQSELDAGAEYGLDGNQQSVFYRGNLVASGQRVKGSTVPEYYQPGDPASGTPGQSYEVKSYDLSTSAGRSNLINTTVKQALNRDVNLPVGSEQNVIIDIRGQSLTPAEQAQIANALDARSGGVIQSQNVSFMQGEAPSALRTGLRVTGRVMLVAGAVYDTYRIATSQNKAQTASAVAGGWAGAWAGGEAGAAGGAAIGALFGGVGAPIGAFIGGIGGAFAGYWAGSKAGENVYNAVTQ